MNAIVLLANVAGWPVIQTGLSAIFVRLPAEWFGSDTWVTAPRRWEREGLLYRQRFAIRIWKAWLPDGGPWLGGFCKKRLPARHSAQLIRFLLETRRAELAHWCMLGCLPIFFLWNPPWACGVMSVYAFGANLPCILAQRYNRLILTRAATSRVVAHR